MPEVSLSLGQAKALLADRRPIDDAAIRRDRLARLRRKLVEKDIPAEFVAKMTRGAERVEARLTAAERALDDGTMTRDEAYRHLLEVLSAMSFDGLAGAINHLVRGMPVAMAAVSEFLFGSIHDVVTWMQAHVDDISLRERALQLQAGVTATFRTAELASRAERA